ncbi:hypothetical protein L7F22_034753 [Adiantum nelumboides]|nr:hypothetical protein [Adiantum nelumboides]
MGPSKRIEWQYVEKMKALQKGQWTCKCNFCGHVWGGGPHRIRSHLLSLPGQGVGPCDSVTEDVKDIVRRLHADASSDGKDSREAIDALVDDLGGSASQSQGDASSSTHGEGSTHASGSSKSNVNSSKKRKVAQGPGGLPAAFGLQARKQADQALHRFFYAEDVPEWKVRSPYFLDMIKAIGNVGPSYVPPSYNALRTTQLNDEVQCLKKEIMGNLSLILPDYVLGELKFGGNAQSIIKDRWLHHTSFLWDFRDFRMSYLKIPKRAPSYRAGRSHGDFICKLKDHFSSRSLFLNEVEAALLRVFDIEEVTYTDASCMGDISHKSTTKLFTQSELCACTRVGGEVQT